MRDNLATKTTMLFRKSKKELLARLFEELSTLLPVVTAAEYTTTAETAVYAAIEEVEEVQGKNTAKAVEDTNILGIVVYILFPCILFHPRQIYRLYIGTCWFSLPATLGLRWATFAQYRRSWALLLLMWRRLLLLDRILLLGDALKQDQKVEEKLFILWDRKKWDIKTNECRELDKFFSPWVECTRNPLSSLEEDKELASSRCVCGKVRTQPVMWGEM